MSRSLFMSIAAVLGFFFGLAFLLVPVQTMSMYGVTLDIGAQFIARYLGSAFIGLGLVYWFARNSETLALRAVLLGGFVFALTGFGVSLFDKFTGIGNAMVWSTVAIYLFLSAGNGYFYFKKS